MPTPSKPLQLVKSHRSNAVKRTRAEAEKALLTGQRLKAWPETIANNAAMKHFRRISRLFALIGKNDALIEAVLNRYCVMLVECREIGELRDVIMAEIADTRTNEDLDDATRLDQLNSLYGKLISVEKKLADKRKQLLDIERENAMTLCSQLRSIPKKAPEKAEASGVAGFMKKRAEGN